MSLDNEIIKKMLEIINNDHALILEIIKDISLNNEEKPIHVEEKIINEGYPNMEDKDILEKRIELNLFSQIYE